MNRRDALKALIALPAVQSIAVANVAPTDVIVVECDRSLTQTAVANIQTSLSHIWPGRKVVVMDAGLKLRIAREGGEAAATSAPACHFSLDQLRSQPFRNMGLPASERSK